MTYRLITLAFLMSLVSFFGHATTEHYSFETGVGSFEQQGAYNFIIDSGTTPSSSTGPSGGANGTTYFAYMETSGGSAYYSGDTAVLEKSGIQPDELSFYYHMYGSNIGTLSVKVYSYGIWTTVWSRTGAQHSSISDEWAFQTIDLSNFTGDIDVRFEAVAAGGYRGDIAIDEVTFNYSPILKSDFETNLGGFYNDSSNSDYDLTINSGTTTVLVNSNRTLF